MGFGMELATLGGLLDSGTTTQTQVPLETPEQAQARKDLLKFAQTGTYGNYTAGADIGVGKGNYSTTGIEDQGLSALQNLLKSGIPSQFQMGDNALASLLNTDPAYIQSQFDPFRTQTERLIRDSNDALKRSAAYGGNLYSTNTIQGLGDIQARGNESMTAKLAELTDAALNRRLQAIPLAYQSGTAQEGINQNRINSAMTFGGLTRNLENAGITENNNELIRRRAEMLAPINALQSVASTNTQYGVPSVEVANANPFLDLLKAGVNAGAQYYGAKKG